jgi:peptidoglycan/xylan/chitin deacetylase (PgdA/CDA1 family)
MSLALSVDLEPNKDGTFVGIAEAMEWFDETVPRGTIYTTYRIARERPEIVRSLSDNHEIAVHVHPKEFGHKEDDLGALPSDRQRELIKTTREAVAEAINQNPNDIVAFRAGRHKASPTTLSILNEIGFKLDASINVRYGSYFDRSTRSRVAPFEHESGIVELPTTYGKPRPLSRPWLRTVPNGVITATANTLRTDRRFCSGLQALSWLFETTSSVVSMYMHPYDATTYHDIERSGTTFRKRLDTLLNSTNRTFVTASEAITSCRISGW